MVSEPHCKKVCPIYHTAKKDLSSPNEEWGVDQQLISKLKEEYKKERKGKKSSEYEIQVTSTCMFCYVLLQDYYTKW